MTVFTALERPPSFCEHSQAFLLPPALILTVWMDKQKAGGFFAANCGGFCHIGLTAASHRPFCGACFFPGIMLFFSLREMLKQSAK